MKKYASDVVTSPDEPLRIIDRRTGDVLVVDNIVKFPEHLMFYCFFEVGGLETERTMQYDSVVTLA